MFKVKLVLYLICSDFVISLNTQNLTTRPFSGLLNRIGSVKTPKENLFLESNHGQDFQSINISSTTPAVTELFGETPSETTEVGERMTNQTNTDEVGIDLLGLRLVSNSDVEKHLAKNTMKGPTHVEANVFGTGDTSIIESYYNIQRSRSTLMGYRTNRTAHWEQVFEKNNPTLRDIPENIFDNQDFRLVTASHGLFFHRYGEAHIFHDVFDQFLKFDLPKQQSLKRELTQDKCLEFAQKLWDSHLNKSVTICLDAFPGDSLICKVKMELIFNNICIRMNHFYDKQVEELQNILTEAYSGFTERIRNKREVLVAAAVVGLIAVGAVIIPAVVGGTAGYYAAKHYTQGLSEQLEKMEKELGQTRDAVKVNTEILAGLSNQVTKMEKEINDQVRLLADNTRFQIKTVEETIVKLGMILEENEAIRNIEKALEEYVNINLASLRNIMILELDNLKDWEMIFNKLRTGHLPRELMGYNDLKVLIKKIKEHLKPGIFEFAISEEDYPLYYTIPLVTFIVVKNETDYSLFLHLKIPIKQMMVNNKFEIVSPHAYPFPCHEDTCILKGGRYRNSLQRFELEQMSYLVNPKTQKVQHEIQLDYLHCHDSGYGKFCYTFHPINLHNPTGCTRAILQFNVTEIITFCEFRQAKKSEYKVIPIQYNNYLFHKDIVPHFSQICQDTPMERFYLEDWAETYEIPELCEIFIDQTQQKLIGSFSKVLRDQSYAPRLTYQSKLIEMIYKKYENTSRIPVLNEYPSRIVRDLEKKFKLNENASEYLTTQLTTEEMSNMAIYNVKAQDKLMESMDDLNTKFKTYHYSGTLWGLFSLFGHSIQMITSLTVIFGFLSYSNIFGLMAATILILPPKRINAWVFNVIPDIKVLPDITVDVMEDTTSIAFFINIGFAIFFFLCLLLFIFYGVFRKIVISEHYGKFEYTVNSSDNNVENNPKFSIMLHLTYQTHLIRYIKIEHIHLKLVVKRLFSPNVCNVIVKNPFLSWGIVEVNKVKAIELSDYLHLIGLNAKGERIEDRNLFVFVPVDKANFNSTPKSTAIKRKGNHGWAFVNNFPDFTRGSTGRQSPASAPPSYNEAIDVSSSETAF